MKKIVIFLFCGFVLFLISGCSDINSNGEANVVTDFEKNVKIEFRKKEYKAKLYHKKEGITSVMFTYPESLKGFSYSESGGKYELSLGGLSGEFPTNPFGEDTSIISVIEVIRLVSEKENIKKISSDGDLKILKVENKNKEYNVHVNKSGEIKIISSPGDEIKVLFE